MTNIDFNAFNALQNAVNDLTRDLQPALSPTIRFQRMSPTGLSNGYIREHRNSEGVPLGSVYGRLITAVVVIPADRAADVLPLTLGLTPSERAQHHFLKLHPVSLEDGQLGLEVVFEYLQIPTETEGGIIEEIDINLSTKS